MQLIPRPFCSETCIYQVEKPLAVFRTELEQLFKTDIRLPGVMYEEDKFMMRMAVVPGSYREGAIIEGYLAKSGERQTALELVVRPANSYVIGFLISGFVGLIFLICFYVFKAANLIGPALVLLIMVPAINLLMAGISKRFARKKLVAILRLSA